MKRIGTWALYVVGTVAILYLALYAYAMFTQRVHARQSHPHLPQS